MAKGIKTGGRAPGTPNKKTRELTELLAERMGPSWSPVAELARLSADESLPVDLRVKCLAEVAPYVHGRRAPVRDPADTTGMGLEALVAAGVSLNVITGVPMPPVQFDPVTGVALDSSKPRREPTGRPSHPPPDIEPPSTDRPTNPAPRLDLPPLPSMNDHDPYQH